MPGSAIWNEVEENFNHFPVDKAVSGHKDISQAHSWLLDFVLRPHVCDEDDTGEISKDLLEIVYIVSEYYGVMNIPPK